MKHTRRNDALKGAEQIAGLHFSEAEEEAAVGGVGRNLNSYETLPAESDLPVRPATQTSESGFEVRLPRKRSEP
jgi:hypothetical protein